MQIPITVTTTRGELRDVVVDARGSHDGAVLARSLVEALTLPTGSEILVDDRPLDEDLTVGLPPLVAGAQLHVRAAGGRRGTAVPRESSPLRLAVVGGPDAGHDLPLRHGRRTVGRSSGCDLTLADPSLSRTHLEVLVDTNGVTLHDLATTNPTRVDGEVLPDGGTLLSASSTVTVGSHRLALRPATSRALPTAPRGDGTLDVSPAPLSPAEQTERTITFPAEPRSRRPRRLPWLMVLVPLPIAGVMAYLFGPRMLLLALLSPLMIIGTYLSDRVGTRSDARRERTDWEIDLARSRRLLDDALAHARQTRYREHPDPYETRRIATLPGTRLWERRREHGAAPTLRLGVGDLPGPVSVTRPGGERVYPDLRQVPVSIDLDAHPVVGLFGDGPTVERQARWLLGQLVTLYPPGEVDVAVLGDPPWARGLHRAPHVRAASLEDLRDRCDDPARQARERTTVVLTDDPGTLRRDEAWRRVLTDGPGAGLRVVLTTDDAAGLPHECRATVHVTPSQAVLRGTPRPVRLAPDGVDTAWGETVGRALAPLRDATPGRSDAVPGTAPLPELVPLPSSVHEQAARWESPPEGLRTVLGQGADGPLVVDLLRDGPHALVGGTTGAGKSELLQAWIAGLATAYGPDRLNLVLVDYKGGAAFAACAGLPHTVGVLTDLDPTGARRALTSLQAEVRRREALLAERGAGDIDAYRAAGGLLPRLLLVVDEFRVLAQEQPEILSGIVRLAAVGRSLGLHLVLATQRPAGIITPDIKANVNLRIALRVRDRADSEDIIGSGEAALVAEGVPGRALLRTGGAPATAFQTAYVGGRTDSRPRLLVRDEQGRPLGRSSTGDRDGSGEGGSDLDEIAGLMSATWADLGGRPPHRPWLPPLPEVLREEDLPPCSEDRVTWGLTDHPEEQRRCALTWGPGDGHLLVVGGSRSGRSTALAALLTRAARHLPGQVVCHLVAPCSPQTDELTGSGVVRSHLEPGDLPSVQRLVRRARADVEDRRRAVRASGAPSYDAWWDDWRSGRRPAPPPLLVLGLDGWAQLSRADDPARAEVAESVEALVREGSSVGVRVVVTGGRELLSGRLPSLVDRRLVLRLPDRGDLLATGVRPDHLPSAPCPGRGVLVPEQVVVQVATALPPATRPQEPARPWDWRVTPLPSAVDLHEVDTSLPGTAVLGHSGEPGRPAVVRLDEGGVWTVVGPPRSGRSGALRVVAQQLLDQGRPVVEVTSGHGLVLDRPSARLGTDDPEALVAAVREHEDLVVVVDDIEDLSESACADVLRSLVGHCSRSRDVLLAATTPAAAASVRGLAPLVCRSRAGLLLQPRTRADGDALGVRVAPTDRLPGRGYLVDGGEATAVQVARAPSPAAG